MLYFVNQANKEITSGRLEKNMPLSEIHMAVKSLSAIFPLFFVSEESLYILHFIKKAMNTTVLIKVGGILEPIVFHYGNFRFCGFVLGKDGRYLLLTGCDL